MKSAARKTKSAVKSAAKRVPKTAAGSGGKPGGKPAAKRAPKAAAKSRASGAGSRTNSRATAAVRRWWSPWSAGAGRTAKQRSRPAGRSPRPRPAAREGGGSHLPRLQRRTAGALLARAVVLAVAFVGMIAFAVALAEATLVPSPASDALVHTNLRPGASIRAYLDQPELRDAVKQIGGNILLGVPFGVLLPALFPRTRGLLRVAVVTALVMVMVETAQGLIVEGRAFDIDDVILNTGGALLGYLPFGRRLGRALHPRRLHWWHRLGYGTPPPPDSADKSP